MQLLQVCQCSAALAVRHLQLLVPFLQVLHGRPVLRMRFFQLNHSRDAASQPRLEPAAVPMQVEETAAGLQEQAFAHSASTGQECGD